MIERNSMGLAGLGTLAVLLTMTACKSDKVSGDGAPPTPSQVTNTGDMSLVSVDKPDQFPLIAAASYDKAAELSATGAVFPDIAREVPVISLASGRVVDIKARLDDHVKKGQLLLKVESPDATIAFDAYLKAVNDEQLARKAYVRAQDLYKHGAISEAMLEAAEDSEKDAQADLKAAEEQLKTMGVDKDRACLLADLGHDRCAERDECGCGRGHLFGLGDCLHGCGPFDGLGHLRRVGERHPQDRRGTGGEDQARSVSGPPDHGARVGHWAGAGPHAAHGQGAHRGAQSA
jgi:hypothetical protein